MTGTSILSRVDEEIMSDSLAGRTVQAMNHRTCVTRWQTRTKSNTALARETAAMYICAQFVSLLLDCLVSCRGWQAVKRCGRPGVGNHVRPERPGDRVHLPSRLWRGGAVDRDRPVRPLFRRDFAAGIGGNVEAIRAEVHRRIGREANPEAVELALTDAMAGRSPRW